VRAETAGQNRRRVLDALAERLRKAPSETVSIGQISRLADHRPAIAPLEEGRAIGARYRVERLADADLLRPDITDEAADILWVLTSFDTFDLLCTGRGDTVDIIAKRLATIAERSLYR